MKKIFILLVIITSFIPSLLAQVTIGSSIPANKGGLLDMKERVSDANNSNSNKGLLLPRVKLNSASDMLPGVDSDQSLAHTGLTVYHVGSTNLCAGVYVWDGTLWNGILKPCTITTKCETVALNGTYRVGTPLNSTTNTITLSIDVPFEAVGGNYHIYTDTVNGMSFSGTGSLVKGLQNVILNGTGTPSSGGVSTTFTIHAEYSNSPVSSTCSAILTADKLPMGGPRIFGFGYYSGTYGYHVESSASKAFLQAAVNFGTLPTSTVKMDGLSLVTPQTILDLSVSSFINASGFRSDPDIIINGYYSYISNSNIAVVDSLVNYLERGGVLILFDERDSNTDNITLRLCRKLFPQQASSISYTKLGGAGSVYTITNSINDDITNGPFKDVRGLTWGEDASTTSGISGLPADSITVYSTGDYKAPGGSTSTNPGYVTMFKHNRLNLFYVGDGGFLSNPSTYAGSYGSSTICPYAVDANYLPIPRTGWGYNSAQTIYNSYIFGNIIYWASKNARSNKK